MTTNPMITTSPNGFLMASVPSNAQEAFALCERYAKSELVPKAFSNKPNDIFVAGMMGARIGLDLFSSLAGIAVINGRATLWGDAMLAVCQSREDWGGMLVEFTNEDTDPTCKVTVTRKGNPPYWALFSMSDAERAGLAKKPGPWTQYPRRMLEMRARSFALRGAYADALNGFNSREETEDMREVEGTVIDEPKPARRRTVKGEASGLDGTVVGEPKQENAKASVNASDLPDGTVIHQGKETTITKMTMPIQDEKAQASIESNEALARSLVAIDKAVAISNIKAINAHHGIARLSEAKPEQLAIIESYLMAAKDAMMKAKG